jgi:hypothetical protein
MAAKIEEKDSRDKKQESGKSQKRESRNQESGIKIVGKENLFDSCLLDCLKENQEIKSQESR